MNRAHVMVNESRWRKGETHEAREVDVRETYQL